MAGGRNHQSPIHAKLCKEIYKNGAIKTKITTNALTKTFRLKGEWHHLAKKPLSLSPLIPK